MALLDPKQDVVFKMLFAEPRNTALLKSLLTAVLRPPAPIDGVTVLDPEELPKDLATDRGVRLDVLVELTDGRRVDVEMECDLRRASGERWLYHWARRYGGRIRRGDDYQRLEPVVCVVFLAARASATRFHSIHRVLEVHDHALLCDAFELHVLQLPRLELGREEGEDVRLERWARFLRFDDQAALESLAQEDPVMAQAKTALEILSMEPSAQRIAEMRRDAEIERRLDRAEDRAEGRAEVLRDITIPSLCDVLGIELDATRRAFLEGATDAELNQLVHRLRTTRSWD